MARELPLKILLSVTNHPKKIRNGRSYRTGDLMVKYMAPSDYHQRALREGVQVRSPSAISGGSDFSSFEELI
jgi:phosphatidylserine decarboxylase